jgi:uncharacterized membrane protein YbhN (UPF0104 family)
LSGLRKKVIWVAGSAALVGSGILVIGAVDPSELASLGRGALSDPLSIGIVSAIYATAFVLRSAVWTRVLPGLPFGHALASLHVSLAGNHLLPLRLGEALRVTSVVSRARVPLPAATASTVMLRAADVLAVVALAAAFGPQLMTDLVGAGAAFVVAGALALWGVGLWWLKRLQISRSIEMHTSAGLVAIVAVISWVLESAVMWQAARWAGIEIGVKEAILITAVTIAAQTVALAPGGIGTYEAAATAAMIALGYDAGPALAAAIGAHALKTAYALVTGGVALFVPSPSAFGRLRLPPTQERPPTHPDSCGPIVLFLPAHDEERSVAGVVARAPRTVRGIPVECIVIDDGSGDRTADRASWAGAEVIRLGENRGLGAAVRAGLDEAVRRDAPVIAFCDADGEYAPEELERLVVPILEGRADYVVGSRFSGEIERMHPHRRLGNRFLTIILSFIARRRISDGQSGYRAFSNLAAREAEIVHDFNYAQVLTLDLFAKGFSYEEVPISYSFRESGSSFVKLGRYLRHVVPAVHRELNETTLILDDVAPERLARSSPVVSVERTVRSQ